MVATSLLVWYKCSIVILEKRGTFLTRQFPDKHCSKKTKNKQKLKEKGSLDISDKKVGNPEIRLHQKVASLIQPCWQDRQEKDKVKKVHHVLHDHSKTCTRVFDPFYFSSMSNWPRMTWLKNLTNWMVMIKGIYFVGPHMWGPWKSTVRILYGLHG